MINSLDGLKNICKNVFINLLEKDISLIKNCNYEPTISGRLAMYFRDYLIDLESQNIFVDVEYDKYGLSDKKRFIQTDEQTGNIRPDIVIHERTTQCNNFLYCEVKKDSNQNSSDKHKVEQQVKDKNYKYGLFINKITVKQIDFQIYTNDIWHKYILKNNNVMELTNE